MQRRSGRQAILSLSTTKRAMTRPKVTTSSSWRSGRAIRPGASATETPTALSYSLKNAGNEQFPVCKQL